MLKRVLRAVQRVRWFLSGEAAEMVVEMYETPYDAVFYPLFYGVFTVSCIYGSRAVYTEEPLIIPFVTSLALLIFAISGVAITATSLLASWWYATEVTELDVEYWGGGAGAD